METLPCEKDILEVPTVMLTVVLGTPKKYKSPYSLIRVWLTSPTNGAVLALMTPFKCRDRCKNLFRASNTSSHLTEWQNISRYGSIHMSHYCLDTYWEPSSQSDPQVSAMLAAGLQYKDGNIGQSVGLPNMSCNVHTLIHSVTWLISWGIMMLMTPLTFHLASGISSDIGGFLNSYWMC